LRIIVRMWVESVVFLLRHAVQKLYTLKIYVVRGSCIVWVARWFFNPSLNYIGQ